MAGFDIMSQFSNNGGNNMFSNMANLGGNLGGQLSGDFSSLGNLQQGQAGGLNLGGVGQDVGGAGGFMDMFNSENLGTASNLLGGATNLFNLYAGMKGLGLAEDDFNMRKDMAETNLSNNANVTNERLGTRQASRLRSQGVTGEANDKAVSEFMAKFGVSGKAGG
jgi:hypothetical protein